MTSLLNFNPRPLIKMEDQLSSQKPENFGPYSQYWSILATSLCVVLLVVFFCRNWQKEKGRRRKLNVHQSSTCKSLSCLRCHGEDIIRNKLMERCREYVLKVDTVIESVDDHLSRYYPRIVGVIQSIDKKDSILRRVYRESGYKVELSVSQPHIWTLPGLKRTPVWTASEHEQLQAIAFCFEAKSTFEAIQYEYERVSQQCQGWKTNTIPTGEWRVFHFFDQGNRVEANCSQCPQTVQLLQSISNFMKDSSFGNAMFSVLEPGSHIEIHTGPCNFRLRCHLPLCASDSYRIRVGSIATSWQVGKLLVFDDSYVHTVWHECKENSGEQRKRVLLIFDVWHPEVKRKEQDFLNLIFSSQ